ncbi:MAG: PA14 domain-containing protein [Acidimicrobiia bacterium]
MPDVTGLSANQSFSANTPIPIEIDYSEFTGSARLELWVRGPGVSAQIVPSNWLTVGAPSLPQGWQLVGGPTGGLAYVSVAYAAAGITLFDPTGAGHSYAYTDLNPASVNPGYRSLDGDDAFINKNIANIFQLDVVGTDGVRYRFDVYGNLTEARSTTDDLHPAATQFTWDGPSQRMTTMTDPVSNKTVTLTYATNPYPCPASPGGFDANAPTGMLCKVTYPDGSTTSLFYSSGQLARLQDPGGEVTDFAYSNGLLTKLRDPLAADEIAAALRADDDTTRTVIVYDGAQRVANVTGPAPTSGANRPQHVYSYNYPAASSTQVDVTGLAEPNGYARRVTYDTGGRTLVDQDATAVSTVNGWNPTKDLIDAAVNVPNNKTAGDGTNLKTTTIYDAQDRATDTYGPSPQAWFDPATNVPYAGYAPNVAHATTGYDESLPGLAAAYWNNKDLSGVPILHSLGIGDPSGAVDHDWGTGAPAGLPSGDNWGARLTGSILLPNTGGYNFSTTSDDGTRLWIDDQLIIDAWTDGTGVRNPVAAFNNTVAGTWHKIRLDYYENTGGANLYLNWKPPGAGSYTLIPGNYLTPRYDLVTSQVDADGHRTNTGYGTHPERGLAETSTIDSSGLNLTTTTTYEQTYYRRATKTLPKGSATTITDAYYGDTQAVAPPAECGGGSTVNQAGLKQTTTDADPDGAGPKAPVVHETRYDIWGRPIASRTNTDTWSCISYDTRGRVTQTKDSSAKTTTNDYTTPGVVVTNYTDSSGTARTTRSEVDLLGRVLKYTDEQGTITRSTYDQPGRLTATYRTFSGGSETQLTAASYDAAGRVVTSTEYLSGTARTTTNSYDTLGRLVTSGRPNGVITTDTYDPNTGRLTNLSNKTASGPELSPWAYGYTKAGKVATENTSISGAARNRAYTYDNASRLTATAENGATVRSYAFDADTNRCADATSCASATYTYDNADRLQSSPYGSGYGYDAHGNLTSYTPTGIGSPITIGYDANDHATTITQPALCTAGGGGGGGGGGVTAPTVAGSAQSTAEPGGGTFTLNLPTGITAGDLLLAGVTSQWSTITIPSGWTLVAASTTTEPVQYVFSKTATGNEGNAIDVAVADDADQYVGTVVRLQNTAASPVDVAATTIDSDAAPTGSLTTTAPNDLVVAFEGAAKWDTPDITATAPAGYTKYQDGNAVGQWRQGSVSAGIQTTAGSTGPKTFALSDGANWALTMVAIKGTTNGASTCNTVPPIVAGPVISTAAPSGTTFTLNLPAGIVTGDLLLASVTTSTSTVTTPTGWTLVTSTSGTTKQYVFSKKATGTEGTSIPITISSSGEQTIGTAIRVQGADPTAPVDASNTATGTSTTPATSLTTTTANELLVGFEGAALPTAAALSATPPSGFTETLDGQTSGQLRQASVATAPQATAGPTGTETFTLSASKPWSAILVAIKPAPAAGSYPTTIAETLAPSGRVLERKVTNTTTSTIVEDTDYGYADNSDSPAYTRPHGGGTITTYLGDAIYTGTTASWPINNAHGDTIGTTDTNANYTANPATDEYGRALTVPTTRLGWLGSKQRFNEAAGNNLIRMGVRLYDPNLGRFLQADPIEGGCANDYMYVHGDPVNASDVSGRKSCDGLHGHPGHVSLDMERTGRYTYINGRYVRQYIVYTTVDASYVRRATHADISVRGSRTQSLRRKRTQIAHADTRNHPRSSVPGADTRFFAYPGDRLQVDASVTWSPDTVDRGSFLWWHWYVNSTVLLADCTA